MKLHELALYPFSVLYDGATRLRNHLYELDIKKSCRFEPVVLNIGNLAVGGTGKTPMIEYLLRLLHKDYRLATLSRGYGRRTYGFRLANEQDTAASLGDEPFQLYRSWKEKALIAVGEERALAIPQILYEHPEVEVILLDDAYQHRSVQADLNILLSTWQRPFFKDRVLPAGRLRESRKGAARAGAVVVTKCPATPSAEEILYYKEQISTYTAGNTPVFFSILVYDTPYPLFGNTAELPEKVVLVSGLANPALLEQEARSRYQLIRHFRFPDHHRYTVKEIEQFVASVGQHPDAALLTSEKDAVKWLDPAIAEVLQELPVYVLPVRHRFLEGAEAFEALITKTIAGKMKV
jgi:tetraacyldisaccharide 4'-kinase